MSLIRSICVSAAILAFGAVAVPGPIPAPVLVDFEFTHFASPSGNIECVMGESSVRCDIDARNWSPPPRPVDCKYDYGQGITLSAGTAPKFVCAGDSAGVGGDPLDYGESITAGPIRCESEQSGITCRDGESGHGFSLSREGYALS